MPALLMIIVCMFLTSCGTFVQFSKKTDTKTSSITELRLNEINSYAAEDLEGRFPDKTNVQWYKTSDGYRARLAQGQSHTDRYYNQYGAFTKEITFYNKENIPESVKKIITGKFPSYSIAAVAAISDPKVSLYQATIQNNDTQKAIIVTENEIDVLYEIKKGVIAYR